MAGLESGALTRVLQPDHEGHRGCRTAADYDSAPALDVAEDTEPGLDRRGEAMAGEQLVCERREEALRDGVVVRVAARAHWGPHPQELAALPEAEPHIASVELVVATPLA